MTATIVRDTMTDTNWRNLVPDSPGIPHIGELGAAWTRNPATPSTAWYIYANRAHCGVAGTIYASAVPVSADYYVECDYTYFSDIIGAGIAGRLSTMALTCYYTYLYNGELVLAKYINGTPTGIGWAYPAVATGSTYKLRLTMSGTTISVQWAGSTVISVTDNSITAVGRGGLTSVGVNDAGTGKHIDNFLVVDNSTALAVRSSVFGIIG